MSTAPAPVVRDVLAGHLGMVRLPARTTALLDLAAAGPDALDSRAANESGTLEGATAGRVAARLACLLDGLCDPSVQADLATLARDLSGLGPGLTPTGDDLLIGVAAAGDRLAAGGCWPATRRDALAFALAGMGDTGTTEVAREMVRQAAAGQFPEPLARFVELLGNRESPDDQVQAGVERLAAIGAHTGADMLAGVVALATRACREGTMR